MVAVKVTGTAPEHKTVLGDALMLMVGVSTVFTDMAIILLVPTKAVLQAPVLLILHKIESPLAGV
jgi:hypothetical protein